MIVSRRADEPIIEAGTASIAQLKEADLFARKGYLPLPGLIAPALVSFLRDYALLRLTSLHMTAGDRQVPNTPVSYGEPAFEALMESLRPRIAEASGRRLYPTYSYFRIYKRGDILKRHTDRKTCEISLTLNIDQSPDTPWPIFVQGAEGVHSALMQPGDGLLYQGCERAHWREAYTGERMIQAFLHYVDADGPNADCKFDGRRSLMTLKRD